MGKKVRLSEMVKNLPITFERGMELILEESLPEGSYKKFGRDYWLDDSAQEEISRLATEPDMKPEIHRCRILRPAPNPKFVYGMIEDRSAVIPILCGRKWSKAIVGKSVEVEEIRDGGGSSYRYIRAS